MGLGLEGSGGGRDRRGCRPSRAGVHSDRHMGRHGRQGRQGVAEQGSPGRLLQPLSWVKVLPRVSRVEMETTAGRPRGHGHTHDRAGLCGLW